MAYFKGLGLTNAAARAQLYLGAYKRADDGPVMPWNMWLPSDT